MKSEQGRQMLSNGMEHRVFISNNNSIVLKRPRPLTYLSFLGRNPSSVIRNELVEAQESLNETNVQIPRTLIYSSNNKRFGMILESYVIGQSFIEEDRSIINPENHLKEQGLDSLVEEYKHEPRNFISNNGILYWIDPTKGIIGRILERMHLMTLKDYRKLRTKIGKFFKTIGL